MKKKQAKGAAIPAGFSEVAVGGSFGVTHDFTANPVLMGKVIGMEKVNLKDDDGKKVVRRVMRVQAGKVETSVWESHQLAGIFDAAKKGKTVWIQFLGKKKLKKGRSVNLFKAAIK